MTKPPAKRAQDLSREDLEALVNNIQEYLFLDLGDVDDESKGTWTSVPDWFDTSLCNDIADLLDSYGLAPEEEDA